VVLLSAAISNIVSRGGVLTTAGLRVTEQQRRSTSGRFDVWAGALQIGLRKPILGSGPGTFAMRFVPYAHLGEYRSFVGRPLNTPLGIFAEEGLLGLFCYLFLLAALFKSAGSSVDGESDAAFRSAVLLAGLAALVAREATFSSFLECPTVACLFWIWAAAIVNTAETRRGY
jgi:O-antigen ligase